ncbi:PorT family protein [Pontibacter qinzhouensis]|uniref:PorT family protein n=1 Tax=Pontibacter qinzhouensis TaxID=2603253 RepID=A0A5C8KBX5_9BACT|nr:porin family protein [Pontibacter qinzhouensis]TXK48060.1 PorT family protein [Pontibacter qinzhouensis]
MKTKKCLLLLGAMLSCHLGFGQFVKEIRAGLSYATVQFQDAALQDATSERPGYFAGLVAQQELNKKWFLRQELVYAVKGHKQYYSSSSPALVSYHYLTLPLLVGYKVADKLSFNLGPELALVGPVMYRSGQHSSNLHQLENLNVFDVSAMAGLSYQFLPRAAVDMRYSHGFRNSRNVQFYNSSGLHEQTKQDGKHRVLQVGLNYSIRKDG